MVKYIFFNINKTKKFYIPFFIVLAAVLFSILCSLAIRENIITTQRKQYGNYAAAAIVPSNDGSIFTHINDEFIESNFNSRYMSDYYAFSEHPAGADILAVSSDLFSPSTFRYGGIVPFNLMVYSSIEKSTHFRLGDRLIKEGRFAGNISECNISAELAKLNNLIVGDYIEIFIYPYNRIELKLEIVGIYEDFTEEISNELTLVASKYKTLRYDEYGLPSMSERTAYASEDIISRNQILTAVSASDELKYINLLYVKSGLDYGSGYDAVVYFAHDENSLLNFVNRTSDTLSKEFVILDSGDVMRAVLHILESTESSLNRFLVIIVSFGISLCGFIVFFILRERTYDIGVFRIKGMSKGKTAFLLSGEVFVVSAIAFIVAFVIYIITFKQIADSFTHIGSVIPDYGTVGTIMNVQNAVLSLEIFLPLTPFVFIAGFLATVSLSAIVGLAAVLFISRHEPMKTMTEH